MSVGKRTHRRDQLVAQARDQEPAESTLTVGNSECRIPSPGELSGGVDEPLQDIVDRLL